MSWFDKLFRPEVLPLYASEEERERYDSAALKLVYPKLSFLSESSYIWASPSQAEHEEERIAACRLWSESITDAKMRFAVEKWLKHAERGVREFRDGQEKRRQVDALASRFKD